MTRLNLTGGLALLLSLGLAAPLSAQVELAWTQVVPPIAGTAIHCGGFSPVAASSLAPTSGVVAAYEIKETGSTTILVRRWRDDGAVSWSHELPAPATLAGPSAICTVHGVETMSNGTAVVVITVGIESFLWKFTADGVFIGESPLDLERNGFDPQKIHLSPVGSDGLLVAWLVDHPNMGLFNGRSYVSLVNVLSGTTAWTHSLRAENFHDVAFSGDNTFVVCNRNGSPWADRIDGQGNVVYSVGPLPTGSSSLLDAAAASPDGRFFFASSFNRLTMLDPAGNLEWTQFWPTVAGYDRGVFAANGDLVLSGRFGGAHLTRFDATGAIVWDNAQPLMGWNYTGLAATPAGGVVASAIVNVFGSPTQRPVVEFVDATGIRTAVVDLEPIAGDTMWLLPPRLDAGGHPWTVVDLYILHGPNVGSQVGRILPTSDPSAPFCAVSAPNSTGQMGLLESQGSAIVSRNCLTLSASQLPPGATTVFLVTDTTMAPFFPQGSLGGLCLGGPIGRYVGAGQVRTSSAAGRATLEITPGLVPTANGPRAVLPGDIYFFQAWHRDAVGGQTGSNMTNAIEITFQ